MDWLVFQSGSYFPFGQWYKHKNDFFAAPLLLNLPVLVEFFFWGVFWRLLESICEKNALFCGTRDTGAAALLFWLLGQKLLLVLVLLVVAWHEGDFVKIKKMQSPTLLLKAYVKKHYFCVLFWIEPFGLTGSTVLFYVL